MLDHPLLSVGSNRAAPSLPSATTRLQLRRDYKDEDLIQEARLIACPMKLRVAFMMSTLTGIKHPSIHVKEHFHYRASNTQQHSVYSHLHYRASNTQQHSVYSHLHYRASNTQQHSVYCHLIIKDLCYVYVSVYILHR